MRNLIMAKDTKLCLKCGKDKPIKGAVFCQNDHMVCYSCKSSKTWCPSCSKEMK